MICEDNVCGFPALPASGRPWVRIVSCNPLEVPDPAIPPVFSGYAAADRSGWAEFRAEYERTHRRDVGGVRRVRAGPPARRRLPDLEFIHTSPHLNLYVYPAEADYPPLAAARPGVAPARVVRARLRRPPFEIPEGLRDGDGALVYLSLGSLGSADVDLMQRLVDVLGRTPHRFIVSKGPQHDQYELAPNMWGEEFVPQPSVLPLVDLVITHGGNNTTTECFHFGKPMVALPLFWDQYDNAQRVHETGFGVRLRHLRLRGRPSSAAAIDRLLADADLRRRHGRASRRACRPPRARCARPT